MLKKGYFYMSENEGTVHVGRVQMTYIETKRFTLNNGR